MDPKMKEICRHDEVEVLLTDAINVLALNIPQIEQGE